MKKVIAILMVLAIVSAFAFAEDHQIKVKADVTPVIPVFALRFANQAATLTNTTTQITSPETIENNNQETVPNPEYMQYTNRYGLATEAYKYGYEGNAIDVGFNLDKGGSVTFYACLINPAKQIETYNLTFSDGVFDVVRGTTAGTLEPTIKTKALANASGCVASGADGTANSVVLVTFDGKLVSASQASPLLLASATYTYEADNNINLLEENEFYYADVVLTVAAN